jgi:ATPase subunit of ABC transporter with duplicated ATPase domains
MRLCFCTVLADEPQVLILDESSNHLDLETLDSLAAALHVFQGAIVMVSHNQGYLRVFANTLWICDDHGGQQQLVESLSNWGLMMIFVEYYNTVAHVSDFVETFLCPVDSPLVLFNVSLP